VTRRAALVVVVAAAVAAPATAAARPGDLWAEASRSDEQEVAHREYDRAMLEGDQNVDMATAETALASRRRKYVERALLAYEAASRARPDAAEPHFRAATVMQAFYVSCDRRESSALCRSPATPSQVARLLEHYDAFEALSPLDPRVTDDVLFRRALLRTKLATRAALEQARHDYRTILSQRARTTRDSVVLGNLAETEMMLGNLDAAIETYRRTLELSNELTHDFGLAVALDRDEQGEEARIILRRRGPSALSKLLEYIRSGDVFYVPDGEQYYYLALGSEAIGNLDDAIELYQMFIDSGAHPQFQARARANRDALLDQRRDPHRAGQRGRRDYPGPRW